MKYILLFCFAVNITFSVDAQLFELETDGLTPLYEGRIRFVDLDNDNDLDLINNGFSAAIDGFELKVYENVNGEFFERATVLPDVRNGEFTLGDFDNDNDLDVLITGLFDSGMDHRTELYENKGKFSFVFKSSLPGVMNSSAGFFDLENDGDLDILLSGHYYYDDEIGDQIEKVKTFIFENNSGIFTELVNTNLGACWQCAMDFADRNGDGLIDLALMGLDDNYAGKTAVYLNNGDKTFTPDPTENFDDVYNGDMTWGDFDNDGDKDILISGFSIDHKITKVYENTGTGWKARPDIKIENGTGYFFGATRWVDYNADGFLDIVLTGNQPNEIWFTFRIYLNDQQGNFSLLVDPDRLDLASSSIDMGDIDNDGDTDFAFMGWRMFNGNIDDRRMMTGLYKNLALQKPFAANTKPVAPDASKFVETSFRSSVGLKWQAGTDAETPSSQLNYNVRIRNANKNILLPTSDLSTGYIKTDRPYNASGSRLWINNIPEGYVFWSVQSVDAAKTGSLFSGEKQFYQLNGPEAIKAEIVDVTHVRLHWNDNSSIETNYRVERSLNETGNFTTLQTLPANSVSLVDEYTFLTDTYYYYRIAAYNNVKSSAYDSLKVLIPTAPTLLTATSPDATRIDLQWNDLSSFEKGYVVERRLQTDNAFVAVANLPAGTDSFHDANLLEGTIYVYRVVAYNEYGQSAYTNELHIKTNSKPLAENWGLEVDEDHTAVLSVEDFEEHYSDVDDDALHHVQFVALPINGNLQLNNVNIANNQTVETAAISDLTFVPNANAFGDMMVGYKVHDGRDYSNQTYTLTVNVLPVNDPPTIASIDDVEIENGTAIPAIALQVSDVDTDLSALELVGESDNTQLITNDSLIIDEIVDGLKLTLLPRKDSVGMSTITISVYDGEFTASTSFSLTVLEIVTGIEEGGPTDFQYFPVPVTDLLHLRNTTAQVKNVALMDLSGRTLMTKSLAMGDTTLDLTSCPAGVYLLQVKTGNVLHAYKLIKH